MKYLVMETHPAYAIVMDEEGRFLRVANMRYQVGDTLEKVVAMEVTPRQAAPSAPTRRRWVPVVISAAACLMLFFGDWFMNRTPYATLHMQINPEVRFSISRSDRVLSLDGENTDGERLIQGYEHRQKNMTLVLDELTDRAMEMDYLHPGDTVRITLDAPGAWVRSHEASLAANLANHLQGNDIAIQVGTKDALPPLPTFAPVTPTPSQTPTESPTADSYTDSAYGAQPTVVPLPDVKDSPYDDDNDDSPYDSREDGDTDYGSDYDDPSSDYDDDDDD